MKNPILIPSEVGAALSDIGRNLSKARLMRGDTAEIAAQRIGVHRATIGRIERGDPNVNIGTVFALMHCYGMTDRLFDLAKTDAVTEALMERAVPKRARPSSA